MNKNVLLALLLMLTSLVSKAQIGTAMYTIESSTKNISPITTMIDAIETCNISYKDFQSTQTVSIGKSNFLIKTATSDDPMAGFNVICIYKENNKLIELKDYNMWTYMYDGLSYTDYKQYTNNRYYILLDLNFQTKALCFVGWPYGGDLPYLTIIILTENDAKLVFHKNMSINNIVKTNNEYSIKIQTTLEEYDSCGKLITAPTYGTIYSKDGILFIKK
ncbi:hypothetical protein [Bacteroides thetaiotaomicron]|uniref:hypothetical protein n=1 Tax=Bacteroides thetaiotaomicron TaxID=818 RepID=UPI001F2E0CDB|nr:hypothetical protein [Bacteroides thetaiotaomicron]MCE8951595.1 hypothetical protein [Bacteroides thetaiotaomicron]MCE8968984.1 hypothetical protein [Bacteroides thetaiotaomicron]